MLKDNNKNELKITKASSPVWQNLKPFRGKMKANGETGSRRKYFEWDHTHSDIEVWDHQGNHLGSIDPVTGEQIKFLKHPKIDL